MIDDLSLLLTFNISFNIRVLILRLLL